MADQSPSEDPSRKFWWAIGIVVPITVALITGLFGQWHKQDPAQALNLAGTTWNGLYTNKDGQTYGLHIRFNSDGTALAQEGVTSPEGYQNIGHCIWVLSNEKIRMHCSELTTGKWPDQPYGTLHIDRNYSLSVNGQTLTGTMSQPVQPDVVNVYLGRE